MEQGRFISVDFEIDGKVQGVCINQYALKEASQNGAVGWMMNTEKGQIRGTIQGSKPQVEKMKNFFSAFGSPYAIIDSASYFNEHEVVLRDYKKFTINPTNW